jgi:hypothetical protein
MKHTRSLVKMHETLYCNSRYKEEKYVQEYSCEKWIQCKHESGERVTAVLRNTEQRRKRITCQAVAFLTLEGHEYVRLSLLGRLAASLLLLVGKKMSTLDHTAHALVAQDKRPYVVDVEDRSLEGS